MPFQQGRGCSYCQLTDYKGRVGIFELFILDDFVRNAIIELKTSQEIHRKHTFPRYPIRQRRTHGHPTGVQPPLN